MYNDYEFDISMNQQKGSTCDSCDYTFQDESDMKRHKFYNHTLEYGT